MKVVELVTEQFPHGWSPEELLSIVRRVSAYYWDNLMEMDAEIEREFTDL